MMSLNILGKKMKNEGEGEERNRARNGDEFRKRVDQPSLLKKRRERELDERHRSPRSSSREKEKDRGREKERDPKRIKRDKDAEPGLRAREKERPRERERERQKDKERSKEREREREKLKETERDRNRIKEKEKEKPKIKDRQEDKVMVKEQKPVEKPVQTQKERDRTKAATKTNVHNGGASDGRPIKDAAASRVSSGSVPMSQLASNRLKMEATTLKHLADSSIKEDNKQDALNFYLEAGLKYLECCSELEACYFPTLCSHAPKSLSNRNCLFVYFRDVIVVVQNEAGGRHEGIKNAIQMYKRTAKFFDDIAKICSAEKDRLRASLWQDLLHCYLAFLSQLWVWPVVCSLCLEFSLRCMGVALGRALNLKRERMRRTRDELVSHLLRKVWPAPSR